MKLQADKVYGRLLRRGMKMLLIGVLIVGQEGCAYQKMLKTGDKEEKYKQAQVYYEKKDYLRCYTLLKDVAPLYKGTSEAEKILFMIADSHFKNKDYDSAVNYYKQYLGNFPAGSYAEEAAFGIAEAYRKMSADAKLDQTETHEAVGAYTDYLELYSGGSHTTEAAVHLKEMNDKLAYKELLSAQLYYRLGDYMGNNYKSAVIVCQNAMKEYPDSEYRQDFALIILKATYQQAAKSVAERKEERYRETVDAYYVYTSEFPDGDGRKEADKILENCQKHLKGKDEKNQ